MVLRNKLICTFGVVLVFSKELRVCKCTFSKSKGCVKQIAPDAANPPKYQRFLLLSFLLNIASNLFKKINVTCLEDQKDRNVNLLQSHLRNMSRHVYIKNNQRLAYSMLFCSHLLWPSKYASIKIGTGRGLYKSIPLSNVMNKTGYICK